MNKHLTLFLCLFLFTCLFLPAADFGLILDQNAEYGGFVRAANDIGDGAFIYSGALVPRFSALIGDFGDLYVSAGFEAAYDEGWRFVPELLRTELSLYSGVFDFTVGRMHYSDPLGFIADGLFDGIQLSLLGEGGIFSAGAWYTGFLYKRRANITMTQEELQSYAVPFTFNNFSNTYFAPRRLVWALSWEHMGEPAHATLSVLGQVDFSNAFNFSQDILLHSQYIVGKISASGSLFAFDLGLSLGLIQEGREFGMSNAAELGFAFMPPTSLPNRLSFLARYTSGGSGGGLFTAFLPITTIGQGEIINASHSGLTMFALDYLAQLHRTFSFGISSSYFIRNDFGTYRGYPVSLLVEDNSGYFLGNEFYGRFLWNPVSDIQLNLGGGVFLPTLGNVARSADFSWRVELNAVISLR